VRIGPDGTAGQPKLGDSCGLVQASFQPGGEAIAGIELTSEARTGPQRFLLAGTHSQLGGATDVEGAFQTLWKGTDAGAPTILVLSEPEPGHLAVIECRVSENLCSGDPMWTGTAQGGVDTAWIVEERPAN
jgi:hypothetical protein